MYIALFLASRLGYASCSWPLQLCRMFSISMPEPLPPKAQTRHLHLRDLKPSGQDLRSFPPAGTTVIEDTTGIDLAAGTTLKEGKYNNLLLQHHE